MEPGFVPKLCLVLIIPLTAYLFSAHRAAKAAAWTMAVGIFFLPERVAFDLPLLPPLSKHSLPSLGALIALAVTAPQRLREGRLGRGFDLAVIGLMLAAFATALTNPEPLQNGPVHRQGLSLFDGVSLGIREFMIVGCPFLVGRLAIGTKEDIVALGRVLLATGLVYALLVAVEVRMSPQLHNWVYGYHAHDFAQTMRWGGYRPTVFLEHGLAVGTFALAVSVLAIAARKAKLKVMGLPAGLTAIVLLVALVLTKSTGSIATAALLVPSALLFRARTQGRIAALLGLLVVAYPASKLAGVFPEKALFEWSRQINEDRAQSLKDRFDNDRILMDRASEKLSFGWGTFGRHRVYNEKGEDISVTDGYWIIQLGTRGLIGLFLSLLLLVGPLFAVARRIGVIQDPRARTLMAGILLAHASFLLDLLPNGLYHPLPFFLAGALAGCAKSISAARRGGVA